MAGTINETIIKECIEIAEREGKPHAHAMLLLIMAALTGNRDNLNKLGLMVYEGNGTIVTHSALLSVDISTCVPIKVAGHNGHVKVRKELLIKTNVNQKEGIVHWDGLQLLKLDVSLLMRIFWVKELGLTRNGFTNLPDEITMYLKQVFKLAAVWIYKGSPRHAAS